MRSSLLGCIPFPVLSLLMLLLRDTKLNVSLSIELGKTSFSSLSSGLGMGMNTTHGRIGRILIRILLGHIGKRADGLARCRLGMLGVGTAPACEFLYLDLWFRNWFGFLYWNIGISAFFCFGLVPKFSVSLAMNLVLLRTFYDWVFICLSLSCYCFNFEGLPIWVGYVLIR